MIHELDLHLELPLVVGLRLLLDLGPKEVVARISRSRCIRAQFASSHNRDHPLKDFAGVLFVHLSYSGASTFFLVLELSGNPESA